MIKDWTDALYWAMMAMVAIGCYIGLSAMVG